MLNLGKNLTRYRSGSGAKEKRGAIRLKIPCLPSSPLLEALEFAVGGNLIALDPLGRVMFSSKLAQEQLEAFFGGERPFQAGSTLDGASMD